MKILMLTPSYYPIKGGAETVVNELVTRLTKVGVQSDILTFNMDAKWRPRRCYKIEEDDGVKIYKIPALNWLPFAHSDRITQGINLIPGKFKNFLKSYDILHFHGGDLTLPFFAYTINKPKIFHSHGFLIGFYKKYFLSRYILKNIAHLYIAISKQMQKEFIELGIIPEKIVYLPNGIDAEKFQPCHDLKDDENKDIILFAGRITYSKGVHILLKSLRYLRNKVHLVLIGPPDWDAKYFNEIQRQINIENRRGFHKITYLGEQKRDDIVKWYQRASIFVLPSLKEALPMTILESLACETPVITTTVGGLPEVIQNFQNGILIQPNNAKELAEAIEYLLCNKDVRIRLGQIGRKTIIERFSYNVIIKKLIEIYEKMLFVLDGDGLRKVYLTPEHGIR